jgi:hypothetical protein
MKEYRKATQSIFVAVFFLISLACSLINPLTAEMKPTATPFPYPANWILLLDDNFTDNNNDWGSLVPEDEMGIISSKVENGVLYVTMKSKGQGARNSVFQSKITDLKDFFISFEVEQKNLENDAYYGLEFRTINMQGYVFMIDQKKSQYSLAYIDTKWNPIIDVTTSTAINSEKPNKIGLLINGSKITMFINDQEIAKISDSRSENSGTFGFTAGLYNPNEEVIVSFDQLQIFGTSSTSAPPTPTLIPPIATSTGIPTEIILPTPTIIPQTDVIVGKVYVLDTNKPIQITVLLLDASSEDTGTALSNPPIQKTVSDSDGQYAFRNVKPGSYIVAVEGKDEEVSFCGDNFGLFESAIGPTPSWVIAYMKLEEKLTMSAGGFLQQDIVIKCQ